MANDGGPAFPSRGGMFFYVPADSQEKVKAELEKLDRDFAGISVRDYFAAFCMSGMVSNREAMADMMIKAMQTGGTTTGDQIALQAYAMADAMIRAREAK